MRSYSGLLLSTIAGSTSDIKPGDLEKKSVVFIELFGVAFRKGLTGGTSDNNSSEEDARTPAEGGQLE